MSALANACRSTAVARTGLFTWIVFNILVGNSDAHLKNISFLVSHEGVQLAPFYDLLSIATYNSRAFDKQTNPMTTQLAWPILGQRQFGDITRSLLLKAGEALNINQATAKRLLDQLRNTIFQDASMLYEETQRENIQLSKAHPELSATLAGEARCLRTILHTIIQPMVAQLA